MNRFTIAVGLATAFSGASAVINETEPNNTFGQANDIVRGAVPWADVGMLSLNPAGDIDWFRIMLTSGEIFTIVTTPQPPTFEDPDTYMGLFDNSQALLVVDDDSGQGRGSLIQWQAQYTGFHYIAITGFGDINFAGNHSIAGDYTLTASVVVPEPGTIAALAAGLLCLAALRKRR